MSAKFTVGSRLHPLLCAVVPILMVAAANTAQFEPDMVVMPIVVSLSITMAMWGLAFVVLKRNAETSAVFTSFAVLSFFFHGHLHQTLVTMLPWLNSRVLHIGLLFLWCSLFAAICGWLMKHGTLRGISQMLTNLLLILFVLSSCQLLLGMSRSQPTSGRTVANVVTPKPVRSTAQLPDVYYIILDGYGRHDALQDIYGIDNSRFLSWLEDTGFYVARKSRSNYTQTFLSLASSTNLRYINSDSAMIGKERRDLLPIKSLIHDNEITRYMKAQGYYIVHMNTNWQGTEKSEIADASYPATLSEFQKVLLETTMLEPLLVHHADSHRLPFFWPQGAELHRIHFRKLEEISTWNDRPTYTFAHFICPHPPYFFGQELPADRVRHTWKNREGYANQLKQLNNMLKRVITTILNNSSPAPILIIQADHGPASTLKESQPPHAQPEFIYERMAILNAYFVPDSFRRGLYPEITPVNTFRLMIQTIFDQPEVELLPDRCYFSWKDRPYDFVEVTDSFD